MEDEKMKRGEGEGVKDSLDARVLALASDAVQEDRVGLSVSSSTSCQNWQGGSIRTGRQRASRGSRKAIPGDRWCCGKEKSRGLVSVG